MVLDCWSDKTNTVKMSSCSLRNCFWNLTDKTIIASCNPTVNPNSYCFSSVLHIFKSWSHLFNLIHSFITECVWPCYPFIYSFCPSCKKCLTSCVVPAAAGWLDAAVCAGWGSRGVTTVQQRGDGGNLTHFPISPDSTVSTEKNTHFCRRAPVFQQ